LRRRVRLLGGSLLAALLLASTTISPAIGHGPESRPMLGNDAHAETGTTSEAALAAPTGFQDQAVLTGLVHPSVIQFAPDGRIFVAEKRGTIQVFDSLTDTSPTLFADLQGNVDDYWDRGLLGLALAPNFSTNPYVYVLYTYDAAIGATAPRWSDGCPTPPGPTTDGCVVSGRLSRLQASGNVSTGPEQVLINDWCQQFPSHSIGTVTFGPDGALYVSGGDGASFNFADYGQAGGSLAGTPTPVNPCNDPADEGGALRSQDIRTMPTGGGGGGASYAATILADAPVGYDRDRPNGEPPERHVRRVAAADARGAGCHQ
jgi:glucose/arabinose dehydrogenase